MSDHKNRLEAWIAGMLQVIDKTTRPSKGSGSSTENYDIQTNVPLAIECKQKKTLKNPTIDAKTWQKLVEEIPMKSNRIPVLFIENEQGQKFAVLDADDFFNDFVYKLYKE